MSHQLNNKKIRICIVSPFGYPLYYKNNNSRFGGGAAVQLYLIAIELVKNEKYLINIITGRDGINNEKIAEFHNIKIFNILPLKKTIYNIIKTIFIFFIYFKKINPDIIIQRASSPFTGICSFYCKFFKKSFIYSIAHEIDVNGEFENRGIAGKMYRFGIDNATFIIAQNEDQVLQLQKYKQKKITNIKVIKNAYEIKDVNMGKKSSILWVARCDDWKRPELFLKLAENFPNEKFVMICPKGANIPYWIKIFHSAKTLKNLTFHEFIPFHEIDQFFRAAKIFVNTSVFEGFPNTFIQASKNRTPIISLKVNPDNFLTLYKCGFSCNDDFNKMVGNLEELLEDSDLYLEYSQNSFDYAKKNHDIAKLGKEWRKVFRKVLDRNIQ